MDEQFIIGLPKSDFIRVIGNDMHSVVCTLDKESVDAMELLIKKNKFKVYKLVEVE